MLTPTQKNGLDCIEGDRENSVFKDLKGERPESLKTLGNFKNKQKIKGFQKNYGCWLGKSGKSWIF